MDLSIMGRLPMELARHSHMIWRTIGRADDSTKSGSAFDHDWSGSALENVLHVEASSLSDMHSDSHEPSISPVFTTGQGLLDARPKEAAYEQPVLMKHGAWSVGLQGHVDRNCKPCNIVHTLEGYKSGINCKFCHLPHVQCSSQSGNRPSKEKLEKCKHVLDNLHGSYEGHSGSAEDPQKQVVFQSSYVQNTVSRFQKNQQDKIWRPAVPEVQQAKTRAARTRRAEAARNLLRDIRFSEGNICAF